MKHVKIITINTWKCDGDYHARMRMLAEQLQIIKPDIIACQECFYSDEVKANTIRYLADKLKMAYVFLPGRFKKRQFEDNLVDSFSGLGIISALPITSFNHFELPVVPDDNERKALVAEIELLPGKKLTLVNTHFTHLRYEVDLRKKQAKVLADIALTYKKDNYAIICGDFNAKIDSAEIKTLMSKAQAIDCYAAGNGSKPRYSLVDSYIRNVPLCVDHIFALSYEERNVYPHFINSGIVLNVADKRTGLYPSDHFGICTTLVIN